MSCGDAVGWETPSGQVGIPTTPGRALRYFLSSNSRETSRKPLVSDLHSHPGSVPMAWPWKALNCLVFSWNNTLGKANLSWA